MRALWALLALITIPSLAVLAFFWMAQRSLMYQPSDSLGTPEDAGLGDAEQIQLTTEDGIALGAWFVSAEASAPTRGTVIVFNGNAGNRTYRGTLAGRLSRAGFGVLLFDYRGYGGNAGAPSEQGLASDARAARAHVARRADVDPRRVVYFGESLGAAVAIGLALEQAPAALVLRSPFSSMADVARVHYPWLPARWILADRYPSIDRVRELAVPMLLIAGDRDRIVPASQTRAVYDAVQAPKELVVFPGADHNDEVLVESSEMIARVAAFVDRHVPR